MTDENHENMEIEHMYQRINQFRKDLKEKNPNLDLGSEIEYTDQRKIQLLKELKERNPDLDLGSEGCRYKVEQVLPTPESFVAFGKALRDITGILYLASESGYSQKHCLLFRMDINDFGFDWKDNDDYTIAHFWDMDHKTPSRELAREIVGRDVPYGSPVKFILQADWQTEFPIPFGADIPSRKGIFSGSTELYRLK